MRTLVETKTVPAEDVTVTTYGCDDCDFTADHESQVEQHYAKVHACRKTADVANRGLMWFKTEADAKIWLDQDDWHRVREVDWSGPGWYTTETWSRPCPRGCCTDHCIRVYSVETIVNENIDEARSLMQQVAALRRFLKENASVSE